MPLPSATEMGTGAGMTDERKDPILICPPDPGWPQSFAHERHRLEAALGPWLLAPIEHMGSTAVPGLPAKPIIDMLALIQDHDTFRPAIPVVADLGWVHAPEPGDEADRTWSFCFPQVAWRTHHLHVVEITSTAWPTWIAFRDHLRTHPETAAEYGRIKSDLAARDNRDRPAYRSGKAPFIQSVLAHLGNE